MRISELFESNNKDLHNKAVADLKKRLLSKKEELKTIGKDEKLVVIDKMMKHVASTHGITQDALHNAWVDEYEKIPDTWIMNEDASSGGTSSGAVASIANPFGIVMHRPSLFGYIPAPKKRKKHKNNK